MVVGLREYVCFIALRVSKSIPMLLAIPFSLFLSSKHYQSVNDLDPDQDWHYMSILIWAQLFAKVVSRINSKENVINNI